ncbi:uncharacterized protein LOC143188145 isoform X2 [Calliopsis andreniformis]|uniref:uncharacterized protein LOC143188145 isoform X2 n=1 Tax=Calliopsis andreniformis TaxID=337506 RepID=UPI003FCC37B0
MSGEQFSLVWNSFPRNLSSGLYTLLTDEQLVDVTLAAEGQILRAHKLILSVCSTYFRELFKGNSCKHPIVILKDVNYRDLSAMLHFMYQGEVNIKQEDIASFLKVAETLQIKGLTTENEQKLEKTLTKDVQQLDHTFNAEKSSIDGTGSELNIPATENSKQLTHKDRQCDEQDVSSREELHDKELIEKNTASSDACCHQDSTCDPVYNVQDIHLPPNNNCGNVDIQSSEEEPLDYTADIGHTEPTKHEPLDYTLDADSETGYKTYLSNESLYKAEENMQRKDFVPDMQLVPYNQNTQTQPFGNISGPQNEFPYDSGCHNKGRRTVKGISNNILPLETTLRVVSELGPTLRMERGKVIRMYSCPWCLRHFTRKENLKLHVRYIHGPLESLTCKLCGNKYKNSNSLRVHSYLYHNAKRDKHTKPLVDGGV